jgi:hypothetical protein
MLSKVWEWVRDAFARVGQAEAGDDPARVEGGEDASQYFGRGEGGDDDKQQ